MVSRRRALRNALGKEFDAEQFAGFQAWQPELKGKKVLICLNTLAMGDSAAVEIAQHVS